MRWICYTLLSVLLSTCVCQNHRLRSRNMMDQPAIDNELLVTAYCRLASVSNVNWVTCNFLNFGFLCVNSFLLYRAACPKFCGIRFDWQLLMHSSTKFKVHHSMCEREPACWWLTILIAFVAHYLSCINLTVRGLFHYAANNYFSVVVGWIYSVMQMPP